MVVHGILTTLEASRGWGLRGQAQSGLRVVKIMFSVADFFSTPNDPYLAYDHFGDVFRPFSAIFRPFLTHFIVQNAYFGHFDGPITRDLGDF